MEVGTELGTELFVGEGTGVNPLNTGLDTGSVAAGAGEETPDGVEACSVANRSDVGAGAGPTSPQPRIKSSVPVIQKSFVLVVIQFDRFKIKLLAC